MGRKLSCRVPIADGAAPGGSVSFGTMGTRQEYTLDGKPVYSGARLTQSQASLINKHQSTHLPAWL